MPPDQNRLLSLSNIREVSAFKSGKGNATAVFFDAPDRTAFWRYYNQFQNFDRLFFRSNKPALELKPEYRQFFRLKLFCVFNVRFTPQFEFLCSIIGEVERTAEYAEKMELAHELNSPK